MLIIERQRVSSIGRSNEEICDATDSTDRYSHTETFHSAANFHEAIFNSGAGFMEVTFDSTAGFAGADD